MTARQIAVVVSVVVLLLVASVTTAVVVTVAGGGGESSAAQPQLARQRSEATKLAPQMLTPEEAQQTCSQAEAKLRELVGAHPRAAKASQEVLDQVSAEAFKVGYACDAAKARAVNTEVLNPFFA